MPPTKLRPRICSSKTCLIKTIQPTTAFSVRQLKSGMDVCKVCVLKMQTAPRTCCVCNQVKGGDQFPLRAYQSLTNVSKPFACIVCHEAQLKEEEDLAHDEGTEDEQNLEMETTNDCSFCYEYFNGPTQEFMLIVS